MSAVTRKDYGSDAIVDHSTETMKRVAMQNSPFSVEATGHDKRPENLIEINSANLDVIETNTRVLFGNKQGTVTEVLMTDDEGEPVPPLVSIVVSYNSTVEGEKERTYTKAELLAAENLFLVAP